MHARQLLTLRSRRRSAFPLRLQPFTLTKTRKKHRSLNSLPRAMRNRPRGHRPRKLIAEGEEKPTQPARN